MIEKSLFPPFLFLVFSSGFSILFKMSEAKHSDELLNIKGKKKILEKLLSDNTTNTTIPTIPPPEQRKTFKMDMNNDILSRVQSFLPQLQTANEQLKEKDPSQLDIENVEDSQPYIEMNLGLGVYDMNKESDDEDEEMIIPQQKKKGNKPTIEIINKDE